MPGVALDEADAVIGALGVPILTVFPFSVVGLSRLATAVCRAWTLAARSRQAACFARIWLCCCWRASSGRRSSDMICSIRSLVCNPEINPSTRNPPLTLIPCLPVPGA